MAEDKKVTKKVKKKVVEIISDLKADPSKRFSEGKYMKLLHGVLTDADHKAMSTLYRAGQRIEEEENVTTGVKKFLDKLLKHAGVKNEDERAAIVDSFEFTDKDVKFMQEAVEEAMYLYAVECEKNMRLFREKSLEMAFKKIARTGKYEGKNTFKKSVKDKEYKFNNPPQPKPSTN